MLNKLRFHIDTTSTLIAFATICIAGYILCAGSPDSVHSPVAINEASTSSSKSKEPGTELVRIDQIAVGTRVHAKNPGEKFDYSLGKDVNQASWRHLVLQCDKRDGTVAEVELLRPASWLEERKATIGETVFISVPECGIDGDALVLDIKRCPEIKTGAGRVVIGTFKHYVQSTIEIQHTSSEDSIECTGNHPIWSMDRQGFVRADSLTSGERLTIRSEQGESESRVIQVLPRPGPTFVFNIEVQGEHVYHVGAAGVLVHNSGLPILNPCFKPTRLTNSQALSQTLAVRGAKVTPSSLRGALPGPTGVPGHAFGKHGFKNDMVANVINNAERVFIGTNKNGRAVNIFWRKGDVVITQGDDITRIITARGVSGITKLPGGRAVPGKAVDVSKWVTNPAYHEVF